MSWKVNITPTGFESFRAIRNKDVVAFARVKKAIDRLLDDPFTDGVKLANPLSDFFRTRVGNHRIIYTIENELVTVTDIYFKHRKEAYAKLKRFLGK